MRRTINRISPTKKAGKSASPFLTGAELLFFLLYTVIVCVLTAKHVFWRDEAQAWLIARSSSSLSNLLHNLRYEGHPPLWHMILYAITRVTWNPEWMKVPNLLAAVGTAALLLRTRTLRLVTRAGLVFSYYMVFEYGIISRNYMLGLFFLVTAVALLKRGPRPMVLIALCFAALSSLPALIVAFWLALLYIYLYWAKRRLSRDPLSARELLPHIAAALVLGASALFAVVVIRPPPDTGALVNLYSPVTVVARIGYWGSMLGRAYLPLPSTLPRFWESSYNGPVLYRVIGLFGFFAAAVFATTLTRREVRWFFIGATLTSMAELTVSARVYQRHVGWLFVVAIISLLLDSNTAAAAKAGLASLRRSTIAIILTAQFIGALLAVVVSFRIPFSHSRDAAIWLQQQHLDTAILVPQPSYASTPVLAYLERRDATDWLTERPFSFVVWNRAEDKKEELQPASANLESIDRQLGDPIVLTLKSLTADQQRQERLTLLAAFPGTELANETYFIYRFVEQPKTPLNR